MLALFAFDLLQPPAAQRSTRLVLGAIHLYQRTLSPLLPAFGYRCRFTPTCSRYAAAVIERHGLAVGGWRALKRIARCGPWTPMGTRDVPE